MSVDWPAFSVRESTKHSGVRARVVAVAGREVLHVGCSGESRGNRNVRTCRALTCPGGVTASDLMSWDPRCVLIG